MTPPVALLALPVASVLAYLARNLDETSLRDAAPVLLGAISSAIAVWLVVAALRRRTDAATATIGAFWVGAGLYYLTLFGWLNARIGGDYTLAATLPFALGLLLTASYGLHRKPALARPLHIVLSSVALVMLATPLWPVLRHETTSAAARAVYDADRTAAALEASYGQGRPATGGRPPDIYHLVFDRYGSAETLAQEYGAESSIEEYLEERGFYVASESHSNYLKTGQSLAATLSLNYLDWISGNPQVPSDAWHPVYAMLDDHAVGRFLQARGYRFLHFGSWWRGTHWNSRADENRPYGPSEFAMYYMRLTVLRTLVGLWPQNALVGRLAWDNGQCQRVGRQVADIRAVGERGQPVYVFAHFLLPHDPFVFAPDGRCRDLAEASTLRAREKYVDQIGYANRVIQQIVSELQDRAEPPVILIQADEGPYPERDYSIPWQEAAPKELRIKTGILNAFFFPSGDYEGLTPSITPVNTYRIVFNRNLGAQFPLLPDRIVAFPHDFRLYEFHDVTQRVREPDRSG